MEERMVLGFLVLVLAASWAVAFLVWRRSSEWKTAKAATATVGRFRHEVEAIRALPGRAEAAVASAARDYVDAQRAAARTALRVEDLRDFGAKNVRWGAIANAGLRSLADLQRFSSAHLQSIDGVGATTAERILAAARAAEHTVSQMPIPLPSASLDRPLGMELVTAIGANSEARTLLGDLPEKLEHASRGLAAGSHALARGTHMWRWAFANKERGEEGSLLFEATELLGQAKEQLGSANLADAKERAQRWTARWAAGATSLALARASYSRLEASVRAAVGAIASIDDGERPKAELRIAVSRREPDRDDEALATYRLATTDGSSRSRVAEPVAAIAPRSAPAPIDARWIPAGEPVTIGGYRITGGMIYVGDRIAPIARTELDDPALIHPGLAVEARFPDRDGHSMSYWPWYSRISPAGRAGYLEWLANGRSAASAYVGYVFLYFYGLERRVFCDAETDPIARGESQAIRAEVERLLGLYGSNGSFRGYATGFLDALAARGLGDDIGQREPPESVTSGSALLQVQVGLGRLVAASSPIPADWALAWLRSDPRTTWRSPATRCPDAFKLLFRSRYARRFGAGLQIQRNRTPLVVRYQPASAGFQGAIRIPLGDLPDVTALSAPIARLRELAEECTDALEPYSKWLARHPEDGGSPAAVATMPAEIALAAGGERAAKLAAWIKERLTGCEICETAAADLIVLWSGDSAHRLARSEAVLVGQFLEQVGCGLEPDVRFGGEIPEPSGKVVLFRLKPPCSSGASPAYVAAATLLRLGCVVAGSDGTIADVERSFLLDRVRAAVDLLPSELVRLEAHVRWLLAAKVGIGGLKKLVATIEAGPRLQLADFAVAVAAADGRIEPAEVKALQAVFGVLGLDPSGVYSRLQNLGADDRGSPGAVRPPAGGAPSEPLTSYPRTQRPDSSRTNRTVTLDPERVRARLAESEAVLGVLRDIFASEEQAPKTPEVPSVPGIWGLDAAHSALVRELIGRPTWPRTDYEDLAKRLQLMPSGALETVNEAAFEACGEALVEGEDSLEVRVDLLSASAA